MKDRLGHGSDARLSGLKRGSKLFMGYHGSPNLFKQVDVNKAGSTRDSGHLGHGFYASTDPRVAESSKHTYHVGIALRSPLNIALPNFHTDKRDLIRDTLSLKRGTSSKDVTTALRRRGHDGVILDYSPVGYMHQEIMAIDPTAIAIHSVSTKPD